MPSVVAGAGSVRRRMLSIGAIVAMVLGLAVAVGAPAASAAPGCNPFPDVTSANQHCKNIEWLDDLGITKPADNLYHPLSSTNRGAMTAFLFRLTHPGEPSPTCTSKPFPDVDTSNVFCGYIQWAANNHIAYGYSNGNFGPDRPVTRGAMASFLHRIAQPGAAPACTSDPYSDVAAHDIFCANINWMKVNGITFGIGGGKYGPTLPVTRQAMASFLHRISDYMATGGTPGGGTPSYPAAAYIG